MSIKTEIRTTMVMQKSNQVSNVVLYGTPIVSLYIEGQERLCLAQISNTLLKHFSYNEIHNRRVALGITCVQCTPVQLEILRRAGAMPVSSRRCGMITRREAERLCKSFLGDNAPPRLPEDFAFCVFHKCAWGCRGSFLPSRYNSSRAKCIKCNYCGLFFSPNKFIFHSHRVNSNPKYIQPDAANFNSWRRHMMLVGQPSDEIIHAWEDVKAMFNGGTRKRLINSCLKSSQSADSVVAFDSSTLSEEDVKSSELSLPANDKTSVESESISKTTNELYLTKQATNNVLKTDVVGFDVLRNSTPFEEELTTIPFSQSFVMDYMWQTQMHNEIHHSSYHRVKNTNNNLHPIPFSLLRTETNLYNSPIILNAPGPAGELAFQNKFESVHSNMGNSNVGFLDVKSSKVAVHGVSAFKPVLQTTNHEKKLLAIRVPSSEMSASRFFTPICKSTSIANPNAMLGNSCINSAMSSLFANSNAETEVTFAANNNSLAFKLHANIQCNSPELKFIAPLKISSAVRAEKSNPIDSDNEDELVDIETTEDDEIFVKEANNQLKEQKKTSHDSVVLITKVESDSLNSECSDAHRKIFHTSCPKGKHNIVLNNKSRSLVCKQYKAQNISDHVYKANSFKNSDNFSVAEKDLLAGKVRNTS